MNIHLFQILPAATDATDTGDAGFTPLANPDAGAWGDIAALRRFFQDQAIDDLDCYAFVPRDFTPQTGLDAARVRLGDPEQQRIVEGFRRLALLPG